MSLFDRVVESLLSKAVQPEPAPEKNSAPPADPLQPAPAPQLFDLVKQALPSKAKQSCPYDTPPPDDILPNFKMALTCMAGPNGKNLPNLKWRIVQAEDPEAALQKADSIVSGKTSASGLLDLAGKEALLMRVYKKNPQQIWLIYASQVRALKVTVEQEDWSPETKRDHALDAMGYSDAVGVLGDTTPLEAGQVLQAYRDHGVASDLELFGKLKKG